MAIIRDYDVTVSNITAYIRVNDRSKTSYAALPTLAEIRRVTGQPVEVINLNQCFDSCTALTTAPTIPNSVTNMNACFYNCKSLTTAPTIPNSVTDMSNCFAYCTALAIAPAIPTSVTKIINCFRNCKSLTTAPTIPSGVTGMNDCFYGCSSLTGKIVIDANPSGYANCMAYTQKEIVLTGSSTLLQNIANTATNSNVYVWSLSINLLAERQEDDFSKVNVSVTINRFRNNNESVSLTFTMNGVESTPVQVTMDTATKTYNSVLSIPPSPIVKLSVIAEDSYGKSAPKSITIPIPFYTIDFQAGGKEIAVGAPANDDTSNRPYGLFKCVMDAQFGGNAEFYGNLALGTALSIANGGTGATTVAGARNALGLGNTSGALPIANGGTGATTAAAVRSNLGIKDYVVEQGTTNGWDYIKYASRKFIAWKYGTANYTCTNASGNMYYSGISTWNLPFTIVKGVANISLGQQCFASNVVLDTGAINFRALRGAKASLTNVETHIAVHGTY